MAEAFRAVPVSEHVHWVGAVDWKLRDFHGYQTTHGTSYNAFLVTGPQPVLIDTVKEPFREEMMARIASVLDPQSIVAVVSNHAELDHSGSLPAVLAAIEPERLIASEPGAKALREHFHWAREIDVVRDGERRELGGLEFLFAETRMLHWPDSMFTFLPCDGVLFSNDAFGMHLAGTERFVDQVDPSLWRYEAAKYFANILLPFSPVVKKLLARWPSFEWDVRVIATDHGPIWRRPPHPIVDLYAEWAAQEPTDKAVVVFATMWNSTARMAQAVIDGLLAGGVRVKVMPLAETHRSDIATEVLDAGALVVGSPTINNEIFPSVADVLTYLKGLKPRGLVGAAFGSYGWSGEGVRRVEGFMEAMKIPLAADGVRVRYVPDEAAFQQCRALGEQVAARLTLPAPTA